MEFGTLEQLNNMLNALEILIGNIATGSDPKAREAAHQEARNLMEKMKMTIRRSLAEMTDQQRADEAREAFSDEYYHR